MFVAVAGVDQEALAVTLATVGGQAADADPYSVMLSIEDDTTRFALGWSTLQIAIAEMVSDATPTRESFSGIDLISVAAMVCATIINDDTPSGTPLGDAGGLHQALRSCVSPQAYLQRFGPRKAAHETACKVSDFDELRPALTRRAFHQALLQLAEQP